MTVWIEVQDVVDVELWCTVHARFEMLRAYKESTTVDAISANRGFAVSLSAYLLRTYKDSRFNSSIIIALPLKINSDCTRESERNYEQIPINLP